MATKAVRIFYRISDNQIVWYHELRGPGVFPTTPEEDLAEIPSKMPDGETPLGRTPEEYAFIEEQDAQRACDFLASDDNKAVDRKLIIGAKRILPEPISRRDLATEIDTLKARIETLEK